MTFISKNIYFEKGEQHSKPLCKIEFDVIECSRILNQRFKIMDCMVERVKVLQRHEAQAITLGTQHPSTLRV